MLLKSIKKTGAILPPLLLKAISEKLFYDSHFAAHLRCACIYFNHILAIINSARIKIGYGAALVKGCLLHQAAGKIIQAYFDIAGSEVAELNGYQVARRVREDIDGWLLVDIVDARSNGWCVGRNCFGNRRNLAA